MDRQPESTWRAAAGSAYPAHHPVLAAACVRSWLRLQHRVDANIAGGRCTRLKLQREAGCLVELDSRLVYLSLVEEAGARPILRVSELGSTHVEEWPLPSGHAYCPLTCAQQYNSTSGVLALPYGGPWEQAEVAADEIGVVLVAVASGSCSTMRLPTQEPDMLAALSGWSPGPTPWLAISHSPPGEPLTPVLWACTASGALLGSLDAPFDGENFCFADIAAFAPSGREVALGSCCLYRGFPEVWLWAPGRGAARHVPLPGGTSTASPCNSCAFSPCSTLLLCHLGSCVDLLDVHSLQVVQHIPNVPGPALACLWGLTGAAVLVEDGQPASTSSGIQLLDCCSSGLHVGAFLSPEANQLHSAACACTAAGHHLAVLTGIAQYGRLRADVALQLVSFASAEPVSHHISLTPYRLDFVLNDSAIVLSDVPGQRHLVLSFS